MMISNISYYFKQCKKNIREDFYFLESFNGKKIAGEIYFAIIFLSDSFPDKTIVSVIEKKKDIPEKLLNRGNIIFVKRDTRKYFKYLAMSKNIFTDTTFPNFFIKRKEQTMIQFWHGTPIKNMGISTKSGDFRNISNVQKNLLLSDWIILNNEWTKEVFLKEYMIHKKLENKIILSSTLKNKIYPSEKSDGKNKTTVLFAYTWKTIYRKNKKLLKGKLRYLDQLIETSMTQGEDFEFYYSLHNLIYNKRFLKWMEKKLVYLKPLYYNNEIYEFMTFETDIVVSDYSSFVFDAAFKNKKIIIDKSGSKKYKEERGFYKEVIQDIQNSFICKDTMNEVISSIFDENEKKSYDLINEKYNSFEGKTKDWTKKIFLEEEIKLSNFDQGILIYPGNLTLNGITSSFYNTLDILLSKNKNITIWAPKNYISQKKAENLYKKYNGRIEILHSNYQSFGTIDKINEFFYKKIRRPIFKRRFKNKFKAEYEMIFSSNTFKKVVHFSTYEWYVGEVMSNFECEKIIYVHNDLYLEYKYRTNFRKWSLERIFNAFDKIYFVSQGLIDAEKKLIGLKKNSHKFSVTENPMPSEWKIRSQKNTKKIDINFNSPYLEKDIFKELILNKNIIKFVSVGRIGALQKNHYTLIKAFEYYKKTNNDNSILLILGGKGNKKDNGVIRNLMTLWKLKFSKNKESIFIFKTSNVYKILAESSVFILPSKYEGQPMVVMEAASLGIPVIVSDYVSLKEQSIKYNHSIITKMNDYKSIAHHMNELIGEENYFDTVEYNKRCEEILDKKI